MTAPDSLSSAERTRMHGEIAFVRAEKQAAVRMLSDARAEIERLRAALVVLYREMPLPVATVCDELIDRSGRLLGEIRHEARMKRATDGEDA